VVAVGAFVVGLVLGLAGIGLTIWMILRIWKAGPRASIAAWITAGVIGFAVAFGVLGTALALLKAFGAAGGESVDPSRKARILAEGISEAINCTAFGVLLWVPSMIVAFMLTRRKEPSSE
jgi:biopolymer transport protein ExbB/TolQ